MTASVNDKFRKASGSTRPIVTSLALPKANGATTAELTSATGWNTTTGIDVVIYRRQLNTTTGLYEKVDGTQTEWIATLTGTTLANMELAAGTEPASGYAADGNSIVCAAATARWADDLVSGLLESHNEDGSLLTSAVQTALGITSNPDNGWNLLNAGTGPNTVTYNGNRSYTLTFNGVDLTSVLSAGMRLRSTRTVAAPTQCTSLNGTNQYYSKSSPSGMTFTDDFVAGAWVKLSQYGAQSNILCRRSTGSGWELRVNDKGQPELVGFNGSGSNYSEVIAYQSIPLNKWVHITAQLDMSTFTATTTTSYIMIDGVDVPASVVRGGTNPTSLGTQAGDLNVGAVNGSAFFPGKIAQAFVTSAKLTQTQVKAIYSQGLTSADIATYSIVSAYSFNNTVNDINTTNANNLTANGSAVATNADSPYGNSGVSSTLDYAIVSATPTFSTNTTVTVQVPEGCTIPTSGGVSNVYYSNVAVPYGFPASRDKWTLKTLYRQDAQKSSPAINTWYGGANLTAVGPSLSMVPGEWTCGYFTTVQAAIGTNGTLTVLSTLSTSSTSETNVNTTARVRNTSSTALEGSISASDSYSISDTLTTLYLNISTATAATLISFYGATAAITIIYAELAYL